MNASATNEPIILRCLLATPCDALESRWSFGSLPFLDHTERCILSKLQRADMPKTASFLNGSPRAVGRHCILNQSPPLSGAIDTVRGARDVRLARRELFDQWGTG